MNRLIDEFGERLIVLKADIQSDAGREIAREFNSSMTPTFVMFDGAGDELWRSVGQLNPEQVRDSMMD